MKDARRLIVVIAAAGIAACAGPASRVKDGRLQTTLDQRPSRPGVYETIGIGAADPSLPTGTQRKSLSRDAAIVKAQYEMLSMIKGVRLEGGVTVDRAIETDSSLRTRVLDTIRGAEVVKSEFTSDDGCVVTLRLPKSRLEEQAGLRFE